MNFLEKSKKMLVILLAMFMVLSSVVPVMAKVDTSSKKTKGEELKTIRVVEDGKSYVRIPLTREQVKKLEKPIYSTRSVGDPIDGSYTLVYVNWEVYDSYFPKGTRVELEVVDYDTFDEEGNEIFKVVGRSDIIKKEDHVNADGSGKGEPVPYVLKQTADYDEWFPKAMNDPDEDRYGFFLRYPDAMNFSITATVTEGATVTVNQVGMSLYSVDWNTLEADKPALKAHFYESANKPYEVDLSECKSGEKYYTTMEDAKGRNFLTKKDGTFEEIEIKGGSKNWRRQVATLQDAESAVLNRFELIDPNTGKEFPTPGYPEDQHIVNDYGLKEGEFTVPNTQKHYKFKIDGDHRTPFNIAVTQQLNAILNLNDGTMDGAQNGKKTVKVWYGEDSTEPTAPKKQNVMFLGWSGQEGATEVADGGFLPKKFTEDKKNYYAVYSAAPVAVQALSLKLNATVDAAKAKEAIANNANMPGKTRDQQVKPTTYAWENVPVTTNPDKNGTNYNVILTYPDGTTATVPVLVKVTDDRTDADKYGANLVGQEIRVWKDTNVKNINWKKGAEVKKAADDASLDEKAAIAAAKEAFKKATVSEGTDPARKTDTVGTVAGKVKVTWEDTSTTLVDQDLIVLNNVVDEGTELPKEGGIKVTFKKGTGVATIENGTADITKIVGPSGYELKTADFPPAQADVNYDQNKVIWEDKTGGTLYVVDEDNNEFTAVAEKLSEETVIPYEPASNDNPTDEHDQNIPTKDSTDKNIDPNKYVRVAVKIDPDNAGVLAIKSKDNPETYVFGPVVSALVRTGTTWETVKNAVDKNRANPGYAFWYWYTKDSEKADQDPDTSTVKENEVKTAYFIKDGQELTGKKKAIPLPTGWHKVTVTKDDATIEDNALYGKTYAVAPKDDAKGTTGMLAKDKFPKMTVKTVQGKEFSEAAWYDVVSAGVEKKVKEPWNTEITKDTIFKAKAEEVVTITYNVKNNTGGTVNPIEQKVTVTGKDAKTGKDVKVGSTATPDTGYALVKWTKGEDGDKVSGEEIFAPEKENGKYEKADYYAVFKVKVKDNNDDNDTDYVKVTIKSGEHGKFDPEGDIVKYALKRHATNADVFAKAGLEVDSAKGIKLEDKWFFDKYTDEAGKKVTSDTIITENSIYTAQYNDNIYPPIIGPVDPDKYPNPIPDKYWIVTFTSDENGSVEKENTFYVLKTAKKTLADLKDKAPKATGNKGYTFEKWTPALDANTKIDRDLIVVASFTKDKVVPPVKERSEEPTIEPIYAGDNLITGEGVPGSIIIITLPDGKEVETIVDEFGRWEKPIYPAYPGDKYEAVQVEYGKLASYEVVRYAYHYYYGNDTNKYDKPEKTVLYREDKYIQGNESGMFEPKKGMTRAEAATILANVLKNEGFVTSQISLPYPDVNRNAWYYDAALTVTQAQVFHGTDEGKFEGNRLITRAEWIATLARFQRISAKYGNNLKIRAGHWASLEVEAAYQESWLGLYKKGLDVDVVIPREEAVYIANRAFGKKLDRNYINKNLGKMIAFPDVNRTNEFFYDIMAAANTYFTTSDRTNWVNSLTRNNAFINNLENVEIKNTVYRRK